MRRLTKEERERYRIHPTSNASWAGLCPVCDYVVEGTDYTIPQSAVYTELRKHEAGAHPPDPNQPIDQPAG